MKLYLNKLISFLDNPKFGDNKHATAIIGVMGEDLNAAAFAHYLEKTGIYNVSILKESPLPGTRKGQRLDRWIHVTNKKDKQETLYQCEIKNWAASAISGKRLPVDCEKNDMKCAVEHYWNHQLNTVFHSVKQPNGVTKVLLPMKTPEQYKSLPIEPLIIYWMPILNPENDSPNPFFTVPVVDLKLPESFSTPFTHLSVFSTSLYLRELLRSGIEMLDIPMPNAERRLEVLSEIRQ